MMRSLWTAASGMKGQQLSVDTISNNISNVATTSFKRDRLEFKDLFYQTMERASLDEANQGKPVNLQVGLGVKPIATNKILMQGNLQKTENATDVAIEGSGYFMIKTGEDEISYTRDGTFKITATEDTNYLTTSEGYYVLNTDGEPIGFPIGVPIGDLIIASNGDISYTGNEGEQEDVGVTLGVVQFSNPQGLLSAGGNLYVQSASSGEPILEADGEIRRSNVTQGYLEMSNVNIADEMINLIVAQRAYELNSKAITTSDEMLQQANNLKK